MDIFVKTDDAENAVELIKDFEIKKSSKIGILDKKLDSDDKRRMAKAVLFFLCYNSKK